MPPSYKLEDVSGYAAVFKSLQTLKLTETRRLGRYCCLADIIAGRGPDLTFEVVAKMALIIEASHRRDRGDGEPLGQQSSGLSNPQLGLVHTGGNTNRFAKHAAKVKATQTGDRCQRF